jgi:hypothetical protein
MPGIVARMMLVLLIFSISCQKEDNVLTNEETSNQVQNILSRKVSLDELPNKVQVKKVLDNLNETLTASTNLMQRGIEPDSVSILTDNVLYMTYAETHTYTFTLIRNNPEYYIENIVLHYNLNTNSYDEYLVQYNVTAENYIEVFDGGSLNENTNVLITALASGTLSTILGRSNCFRTCQTITTNCTAGGNHPPGDPECCVTKGECSVDQGGFTYQSCGVTCIDITPSNDIDAGDSAGGGSGGGNPDGSVVVTNPNPTEPCQDSSGQVGITGSDGCITTFSDPNNCEQLMNLIETPEIISPTFVSPKRAIINLKTALNTFNPSALEQGFTLSHDTSLNSRASSVPSIAPNFILYPDHANIFGGIHLHPNNGRAVPMFSGGDILTLLQFSNNYNNNAETSPTLFTHIVVTTQGVYAIKINNLEALQQLQPFLDDFRDANGDGVNEYKIFTERLDKPLRRFADNFDTPNGTSCDYERVFLRFINNFDGNGTSLGVDLYRANEDLTNWDKLTLNESTNIITPAPCRQN